MVDDGDDVANLTMIATTTTTTTTTMMIVITTCHQSSSNNNYVVSRPTACRVCSHPVAIAKPVEMDLACEFLYVSWKLIVSYMHCQPIIDIILTEHAWNGSCSWASGVPHQP